MKHYVVTVEGKVLPDELAPLLKGVYHDGERLRAQKVRIVSSSKSQTVIELQLAEGKNREVRRMFEVLHRTIKRLQRTQVGKLKLGELRPGKWRTLTEPEIKSLLSAL
jgi:23S rRNA pseudouridine2605 synthase